MLSSKVAEISMWKVLQSDDQAIFRGFYNDGRNLSDDP